MPASKKLLNWISEIQSIAQCGLAFTKDPFDEERFQRLRELAAELAAECSDLSLAEINHIFSLEKGYATPKVDMRAFALKGNKLLLVKERSDGLWTLPGGWADVNESPSEAIRRETKEESGFDVEVIRIIAFWDKLKHDHPPEWPHAYKCFFHCNILAGKPEQNLEISEIDFFAIDKLPPLSLPRVTKPELLKLYENVQNNGGTLFD
ncbi:MAG: NUDIX hydrolase [Legionellales bacterium RIFCSPHIGHO2_12_FULL_37_14]|nr:MAG: NUDIX hydrolase [Legionellales bacterium RIFCSPHIGHO2_12_FULL_37_14]